MSSTVRDYTTWGGSGDLPPALTTAGYTHAVVVRLDQLLQTGNTRATPITVGFSLKRGRLIYWKERIRQPRVCMVGEHFLVALKGGGLKGWGGECADRCLNSKKRLEGRIKELMTLFSQNDGERLDFI
ncbi:hypothetical protein AVEN_4529-1 [Araneus ventricosus]|uniref:Uncharacterized protein n=1 Tax=Araneus ventricosus TaxID=182803 RepID=A0A4Y2BMI7_ARAVE|nr:hypothetical protein AVEN_4529-1 [Araneus ventricosus]